MKKLFTLLISTSIILSCSQNEDLKLSSNVNSGNDWAKFNLRGDVKSFRETKFLAVNDFSIVENGEKKKHIYNQEVLFNLDGFRIEQNDYMTDGTLATRTMYLYQNNKLVEYNNYDSQGLHFGIGKYQYDDKDNITGLIDRTNDGRDNFTKTFEYDEDGNIIEENQFTTKEVIESKIKYNFDEHGKIVATDFIKENKLIAKNNLKYDEDGNLVELNYADSTKFTYKYSYDFKGNWVKKIVFENGSPSGILVREIEYFN